jgi:hypothetical protein
MLRDSDRRGVAGLVPTPPTEGLPPFFWAAFVLSIDRL